MSTSITITGSGSPIPDPNRAGPGAMVRYAPPDGPHLTLQFDVGRSTVQRLAGSVWIPDLTAVFLTHYHSDHVSGLSDLVLTYWIMDRAVQRPPLPVISPSGATTDFVTSFLHVWERDIEVRAGHSGKSTRPAVESISFDAPAEPTEVWRSADGDVVVSASQVRHEPVEDAVGYRVDTPDGSVVISGDTRVCEEMAALSAGADVVVYEAMRFSFYDALPEHRQYVTDYHADTRLIGAQAAELGIPKLVLTHLIPGPNTDEERKLFYDEVRAAGYEGDLVIADDLYTCAVGSEGLPEVDKIVAVAEQP